MNRVVIETVVRQMEEWCADHRGQENHAAVEAVAFWARTLKRTFTTSSEDDAAAIARREREIAHLKTDPDDLAHRRAASVAAVEVACPGPPRTLVGRMSSSSLGRFTVYWLTIVAAIAVAFSVAGGIALLVGWVGRITGSEITAFVTGLLLTSLLVSWLMHVGMSSAMARRFGALLQRLERH